MSWLSVAAVVGSIQVCVCVWCVCVCECECVDVYGLWMNVLAMEWNGMEWMRKVTLNNAIG